MHYLIPVQNNNNNNNDISIYDENGGTQVLQYPGQYMSTEPQKKYPLLFVNLTRFTEVVRHLIILLD